MLPALRLAASGEEVHTGDLVARVATSVELDGLPKDPADRPIVATALRMGAGLLTADGSILVWPGPLARHDARL